MARGHEREQLLSVHRLEEMSSPALDALDRSRTVIVLTLSPLETHGPHLPVGVEFSFQWTTNGDAARLENVTGDKADPLKARLEGDFEKN